MPKPHVPDPDRDLRELVQDFKLLADETRLKILAHLTREHEVNVTDLCRHIGQSQPGISHHLAMLRVAGLIEARREGKHNFYRVVAGRFASLRDFLPMAIAPAVAKAQKARRAARLPKVERVDERTTVAPTVNGDAVEAVEETALAAG